jgi:hypothetical protein
VDQGPTGEARLHSEPSALKRRVVLKVVRGGGTRTDEAHLSQQDVPELRSLVDPPATEKPTDVILGSSSDRRSWLGRPDPSKSVLSFHIGNGRPPMPNRSWRKRTEPRVSHRISVATTASSGRRQSSATRLADKSRARLPAERQAVRFFGPMSLENVANRASGRSANGFRRTLTPSNRRHRRRTGGKVARILAGIAACEVIAAGWGIVRKHDFARLRRR